MTPAGRLIQDEIAREGPILFSRFMEIALYHPEHGYYRRPRDPFGAHGDFFTAEQLQPVFGRLIARAPAPYRAEFAGAPMLVELGAGRREMAPAFHEWSYSPVESGAGNLPDEIRGVIFANEFFDALPVNVVERRGGELCQMRVDRRDERFAWKLAEIAGERERELRRFAAEGQRIEANTAALDWIERIAERLHGYLLVIDYGYEASEAGRFPRGTLMGYHRHTAREDVLEEPGERDITSHVCFTDLMELGERVGLETIRFETLAQYLLRAGGEAGFEDAVRAESEPEALRLRMQLKTLLFGMGDTFRVWLARTRK